MFRLLSCGGEYSFPIKDGFLFIEENIEDDFDFPSPEALGNTIEDFDNDLKPCEWLLKFMKDELLLFSISSLKEGKIELELAKLFFL